MPNSERVFTSEHLRRLQEIFDRVCDELGIGWDSVYAKGSREFLAKLLFRMQDAEADPVGAARKLLARGRSYGLNRRITRADRARSAPS